MAWSDIFHPATPGNNPSPWPGEHLKVSAGPSFHIGAWRCRPGGGRWLQIHTDPVSTWNRIERSPLKNKIRAPRINCILYTHNHNHNYQNPDIFRGCSYWCMDRQQTADPDPYEVIWWNLWFMLCLYIKGISNGSFPSITSFHTRSLRVQPQPSRTQPGKIPKFWSLDCELWWNVGPLPPPEKKKAQKMSNPQADIP